MRWWELDRLHGAYDTDIPRPSRFLFHSRWLLGGVIAIAAALTLLATFAHDLLLEVDEPVSEAMRSADWLAGFVWMNDVSSELRGAALALTLAVPLWRVCRVFAIAYPAAVGTGAILNVALKLSIGRPRPPDPAATTFLPSFPSGHALHAVIVWGLLPPALYLLTRRRSVFWISSVASGAMIVGVAAMRVHLGAHWPFDVLISLFYGTAVLLGAEYLVSLPQRTPHRRVCPLHGQADPPRHVADALAHPGVGGGGDGRDASDPW